VHTLTLSDQHLNVIMELLSNASYRVAAPVIQEIARQIQQAQQPIQVPQEQQISKGNGQ